MRKVILQTIINAENKAKAYHGADKAIRKAGLGNMFFIDDVGEVHRRMNDMPPRSRWMDCLADRSCAI